MILFGLCGHGNFDMAAYDAYLAGTLEDPEFSEAERDAALAKLPRGRAGDRLSGRRVTRAVGPERPDVAVEVAGGVLARAVVLVGQPIDDLGARRLRAVVVGVGVVETTA